MNAIPQFSEDIDDAPRIERMSRVMARTNLPRSTIYHLMNLGQFPRNFQLGPRASGWLESEVTKWIRDRAASRELNKDFAPVEPATLQSPLTADNLPTSRRAPTSNRKYGGKQ